jgi:hypothetical protein
MAQGIKSGLAAAVIIPKRAYNPINPICRHGTPNLARFTANDEQVTHHLKL